MQDMTLCLSVICSQHLRDASWVIFKVVKENYLEGGSSKLLWNVFIIYWSLLGNLVEGDHSKEQNGYGRR
jgi:hypothetical protein